MAKRYGGQYSPDDSRSEPDQDISRTGYAGAQVDPVGVRANLMFIPAIPLVFTSLNDGATGLAIGLGAAGAWVLGAWLLREGLRAEVAFNARRVAKRPAIPRKIFSSVLTGVGTALAAYKSDPTLVAPLIYGGAAVALHLTAFGLDPLSDKGVEGIDQFQQNRVARAVDEAETYLGAMSDAIRRAGDRRLETRVEQFQTVARDLFRTVEEDPRDLTAARKYLTVYLMGARDATVKFADIYVRSGDAQARTDYETLLDDLEQNFAARNRKMLLEDRSDLTIEIDVLRDRLQREGIQLNRR
ncbi:5-bromo-4-chloroindolyl phosphate hydrolysis family protein [Aliisedimentitalea scapharcae]|uniref:5-bromo-4-chloroindolyl phosphate hydrolysis family protein n=1 Tax=Aliisedimentitalea scapharcae TaxID=1524259 RepID=A0ABZ2Y013_9RHOB